MDKTCNQCNGEIIANEDTVLCRMCKSNVHVACARAATASVATRSVKRIDKFVCRLCILKGSDTASQSSETSEILEEDSIKSILAKMNKKLQCLDEKI
jgi:hypothetical protein